MGCAPLSATQIIFGGTKMEKLINFKKTNLLNYEKLFIIDQNKLRKTQNKTESKNRQLIARQTKLLQEKKN